MNIIDCSDKANLNDTSCNISITQDKVNILTTVTFMTKVKNKPKLTKVIAKIIMNQFQKIYKLSTSGLSPIHAFNLYFIFVRYSCFRSKD